MDKYSTLVNILDRIRFEAPKELLRYRAKPDDTEKLNQARSRALIHLYLKVSFGLLDFKEREKLVTDGSQDGGVDAYYINDIDKKIILIQSKFRANSANYENKEISLSELLKMDVDRISDGESTDEDGTEYNGKIKQLLRDLSEIPDIGRYSFEVIILANLKETKQSTLKKLTGGFPAQIFDFNRTYKDLVFPVVTGTFYNNSELCISLNLTNKSSSSARISYNVETEYKDCDITVVFVPTEEIGRILYKYKNSILKFNPRCFLELRSNDVNKDIYQTIINKKTNEFALFNNGITMLSDDTSFNERIGQKDKAQIVIENPQIINGGQTAFTLSRIFEEIAEGKRDKEIFNNKEVLLKIITFSKTASKDEEHKLRLIEAISKATNRQSQVSDADRRSNDKIQIDLQNELFDQFGIYYERKKGEYSDGVKDKYISRNQIIDREVLLRLAMACDGLAAQARRNSSKVIFQEDSFTKCLNSSDRAAEYFYAYLCHQHLGDLEKNMAEDKEDAYGTTSYGQAFRYGKYAVTSISVATCYIDKKSIDDVKQHVSSVLNLWLEFERYASEKPENSFYFRTYQDDETGTTTRDYNYDGYYKGRTLNADLNNYFKIKSN
ncbi:MAG: AIPR family protein [Methylobacter sp.]|nr:AIPR family protein [Methylobacter sp.]